MMAKRVQDFLVVENQLVKRDICILELLSSDPLPEMLPGQFVQVRADGSPETLLRRPFSLHDVDIERKTIKLLVQVVGNATKALYDLKKGDNLNLVLPLGNSFSSPSAGDKIILIGGGSGIAPLYFLAKHLNLQGHKPDILVGFRNSERVIEYQEFRKFGNVHITTEDGSEGEKGYVTDHSALKMNGYNRVYCCGPDAMMKAVAKYSVLKNIFCEVSLENLMGCGFGICLCCIVKTTRGNICTCTEGQVFNIKELKW
jgi:dihydroorotate dehydrogenase electron transfer subunit